jgi:hypothetical protein
LYLLMVISFPRWKPVVNASTINVEIRPQNTYVFEKKFEIVKIT